MIFCKFSVLYLFLFSLYVLEAFYYCVIKHHSKPAFFDTIDDWDEGYIPNGFQDASRRQGSESPGA